LDAEVVHWTPNSWHRPREPHPVCSLLPTDGLAHEPRRHGVKLACHMSLDRRSGGPGGFNLRLARSIGTTIGLMNVVPMARLGGRPLEPLRAADAQQLCSTKPHKPLRTSPPARRQ
jgi:hypothetical protein